MNGVLSYFEPAASQQQAQLVARKNPIEHDTTLFFPAEDDTILGRHLMTRKINTQRDLITV